MSFLDKYKNEIMPFCDEYERDGYFASFDGRKMHYLSYINDNARANVLILHGFTEFAKKLDEMAYHFFSAGYSVYSLDLRGHGLSYKMPAPQYAVNSNGFDEYARDVECFCDKVIGNALPLYCYTHSLGGNVALISDIKCDRLVLSSPMICGNMGMPVGIAKVVSSIFCAIGKGDTPAPNKCEFHPELPNNDAVSLERGNRVIAMRVENQEYQTCGPTFNWVRDSIRAKDKILTDENVLKLSAPMLLIKPEQDAQLLEKPQDAFVSLCKKHNKAIEVIRIKNTHHEIFQSEDKELMEYIDKILSFFE